MNLRAILLCGALSAATLPAADPLTEEFQRALFEEEANRNLPAAIAGYEALVKRLDEQRQLAATAVFRMGESYRKLGKTNEAVSAYERIIKEFADQETLVKLSGQNLSVLRPQQVPSAFQQRSRQMNQLGDGRADGLSDDTELRRLELLLETVKSLEPMSEAEIRTLNEIAHDEDMVNTAQKLGETRAQIQVMTASPTTPLGDVEMQQNLEHAKRMLPLYETRLTAQRTTALRMLEARVEAARRLAGQGTISPVRGSFGSSESDTPAAAARQEYLRLKSTLGQLQQSSSRDELKTLVQVLLPDANLGKLDEMEIAARTELAGYQAEYGPENIEVKKSRAKLHSIDKSIDERIAGAIKAAVIKLAALEQMLDIQPAGDLTTTGTSSSTMTAEEAEELRRVQAIAANSPDLLNQHGISGGLRPIEQAADKGWVQVIDYLLKRGARADLQTTHGRTPLHIAAEAGHLAVVERLMQQGVGLNSLDNNGRTALFIACESGFTGVAAALMREGADVNVPGRSTVTDVRRTKPLSPLVVAKAEISRHLLHRGALPDGPPDSEPPIVTAGGDTEKLELLLAHKAKPGVTNSVGETALHYAVEAGNLANVRRLLALGLNPNARDASGKPVIEPTSRSFIPGQHATYWEVLTLLVEVGTEVNTKLSSIYRGRSLLHEAARYGDLTAMTFLIEKGADLNSRADDGHTPLHVAAAQNQAEAIRLLAQHKAEVNAADKIGDTPLHFAVMTRSIDAAKALIDAGANRTAKNQIGNSPAAYLLVDPHGYTLGSKPMSVLGIPTADGRNPHNWIVPRDPSLEKLQKLLGVEAVSTSPLGLPPLPSPK